MEKPTKKQRTQAQEDAFQKMIAARDAAIALKTKSEPSEAVEPPEPIEPPPRPPTPSPKSTSVVDQMKMVDDEDEVIEFDPDEVFEKLTESRQEIATLKKTVEELMSDHGQLKSSFVKHHVAAVNTINFV